MNNILGVGIDLVSIDRMERILERTPHFFERVFQRTEKEKIKTSTSPASTAAGIFAVKEASAKALGCGLSRLGYDGVCVHYEENGRPFLTWSENKIREAGYILHKSHVSISHDGGLATAIVILEGVHVSSE